MTVDQQLAYFVLKGFNQRLCTRETVMRRAGPVRIKQGLALVMAAVMSSVVPVGTPAASADLRTESPGWPANPNWRRYVQTPSTPDVHPVGVVGTSGDVANPQGLTNPRAGEVTTLTATTPQRLSSSPVTLTFADARTRYVQLHVTRLGLTPAGDPAGTYVQLAELQVFGDDPSSNLAAGRPVAASDTIEAAGWGRSFLTDGVTDTQNGSAHGWTSTARGSTDTSASPVWVTIDLGSISTVSRVVLWPRTDTLSPDGRTASFPVDYSIRTSATDGQPPDSETRATVTGQSNPPVPTTIGGASIILDYGHEVGGFPTFDVSAVSGSPTLQAGYSETRTQIGPRGDGVPPWASGDPNRYNIYQVSRPGRITNPEIQGGQRYQQISLTTPGSISFRSVAIRYTAFRPRLDRNSGYFISSSDELNRYWHNGVYTTEVNQLPVGTTGPRWNTDDRSLDVPGSTEGAGLLTAGTAWTDYTVTFQTKITADQAGWMLRGQDAQHGYLLILDAADDTVPGGGPNVLQQISQSGGTYKTIANVPLPAPVLPGTWHTVKEVVSGTTVTTYLDGRRIASFDSAAFAPGTAAYATGSFGFRQFTGEQASFRRLSITSPDGLLYQNSLSNSAAIADFTIPGRNAVPLILDGAKRDRAVWSGDLAVEGPTVFYSSNATEYVRGSLELLGSWAGSDGYVSGSMPPQTPINTGPPGNTRNGYSASYSMYFVRVLAEYYQHTADREFVLRQWPLVAKELAWSAAQVGANGLFVTTSGNGADWDYYDGPKTGEVTAYNALYYRTLLDGVHLANAAGHPDVANQYAARAAALRTAINARLFNAETGIYELSDTVRGVVAQDANVLAIEFGVAPADKVPGILAKIKNELWTPAGPLPFSSGYQDTISPFISGFELNARFRAGDTTNALRLLTNTWSPMIAPGDLYTGTFWENESINGTQASNQTSMAHGWSAMPTSALSKYVLGIQPVEPGYRTWLVRPQPGDLAWTKGQAPTPHGPLAVAWSHNSASGQFTMRVQAPSGTSGTVAVPTFGRSIDIKVNGRSVWRRGRATGANAGVRSASLHGDYVELAVGAGQQNVSSAPTPAR
ncbi:alpha-L-rhamnosidase C-terminal domain-containing protein [Actinoplanes sp. NPDC051470]|uniref:alpha-L-rhamnosidase-related protein n=1 Tax=Actinoplanes sp. NPDC051470 TaxID=3157224 RepID=UPI0034135810